VERGLADIFDFFSLHAAALRPWHTQLPASWPQPADEDWPISFPLQIVARDDAKCVMTGTLDHAEAKKMLRANPRLTEDDLGPVGFCEAAHIIPHGQNEDSTGILVSCVVFCVSPSVLTGVSPRPSNTSGGC
jgi:hypothetical protein